VGVTKDDAGLFGKGTRVNNEGKSKNMREWKLNESMWGVLRTQLVRIPVIHHKSLIQVVLQSQAIHQS
jgi:hypothetical protein